MHVDLLSQKMYVEFEAKFGEVWSGHQENTKVTLRYVTGVELERSGLPEKHKSHTSTGRTIALLEGLSHDLVCAGSNMRVHFTWQVWHGQYSPGFKSIN